MDVGINQIYENGWFKIRAIHCTCRTRVRNDASPMARVCVQIRDLFPTWNELAVMALLAKFKNKY